MEYPGSLKDVSTLKSTLETCYRLGKNRLRLVMDKGFYGEKNLKDLIRGPEKAGFIMAVPFTTRLARDAAGERREVLGNPKYVIPWDKQSLQGICGETEIEGHTLFVHVYYNMAKEAESKSSVCGYAASLAELAKNNPFDKRYCEEFDRYLRIRKSGKTGLCRITLKEQNIKAEYSHDGWMVPVSNYCKSSKGALEIYRAKDVVEKGFFRLKNDLDLHQLRAHRDETMEGKIFIGFISLILLSYIHKIMTDKGMYKYPTMKEMVRHLGKLKVQTIMGNRIVYPLTKMQKMIFENFDIPCPV
jgi:transposase